MINWFLRIVSERVQNFFGRAYYLLLRLTNSSHSNADIFSKIYESGMWGGDGSAAFSGLGSRGELLSSTVDAVNMLIADSNAHSILDIGCGDGEFVSELLRRNVSLKHYCAIDVSRQALTVAKQKTDDFRAHFEVIDASSAAFEYYDLVLIRQVLQHLSNETIQSILDNIDHCGSLLVIEHRPSDSTATPNKNIPTGASTRRFKNSFVDLSKPPFNHSFTEKRELSKIEIKSVKGYLVGTYFCRKVGDSSGGSQLLGTKTSAKL